MICDEALILSIEAPFETKNNEYSCSGKQRENIGRNVLEMSAEKYKAGSIHRLPSIFALNTPLSFLGYTYTRARKKIDKCGENSLF